MCLGIPGMIKEVFESSGTKMCKVDFGGVIQEACIETIPEAKIGDYIIVHAGFALSLLSKEEALETIEIFKEMTRLADQSDMDQKGN
jgi:hydrogenase expression/formation protein HypC